MHSKRHNQGFTLVEMLVYIAVTVLVTLAGVTTFISLNEVFARNQAARTLTNAADVTLGRMLHDIRGATTVDTGLSTLGSSPGVLVVDTLAGATTTTFFLSSGTVHVSQNGTDQGPLTPEGVDVDSMRFYRYLNTNSTFVRIELTLSIHTKAASSTRTYRASAVLRGSYN